MIRHICMFQLKEEDKERNLKAACECVNKLNEINLIKRFEVVINDIHAPESNYDLCLIFDFESFEDLDAYQKNPIHLEFAAFITGVRKNRACIDYVI